MSDNIELVIFASEEQTNEITEGVPITHRHMLTVNEFKGYFNNLSGSVFIILLFFNPSKQILDSVLQETETRKGQIICRLIWGTLNDNLTNNLMNILFISELLVPYKIKSTSARFLGVEYMNQWNLGNIELGKALHQQRTMIIERFHMNEKLKACHILLIPLNATPRNLHNAQQSMKNICSGLYGNEYEFKIHTLFDYIPEDENDPDDESYTAYLEKQYKGKICDTIMELSFIRMYVVGNERHILNKWSQKLVAAELDINQDHILRYVDRCSFITNQPLANQFTQDLVPLFGATWQIQRAFARTLDDICNDINFQDILPRIHGCLENREITINYELQQQSLVNAEDITRFSSEIHLIQPAQDGPEEQQETGDIRNMILHN